MDQSVTNKELFQIFLYDYLNKSGLSNTAQSLRNEAGINGQTPPEFNLYPHGFLYDLWMKFHDMYISRQDMPGSSGQSQAPNVGAIMDTTPQIIREGYFIRHISCFPSHEALLSCDYSSDGSIVASVGFGTKPFICYMDSRTSAYTSASHLSTIFDVRFKPGSTIFATSSADKTVKLWDAKKPARMFFNFRHSGVVRSLDFHPTEEFLCSSDSHDGIHVCDLNQGIKIKNYKAGVGLVRFQPVSGMLLAVSNQNVINLLDFKTLTVVKCLQGHIKYICSFCWDVTGQMIASVSEDCVRVWTLSMDGQCLYEYPSKGKMFMSVIFHPRYRNVLVVGGFQFMEFLILECNGQIRSIPSSCLSITGLAACTRKELFASTSNDYAPVVNIWK